MADIDKLQDMRANVLKKLRTAVNENLQDLESAVDHNRIATVAWLSRNILELCSWTAHCAESEVTAKKFVLDAARDATDALNLPDGLFSRTFSFKAARQEFIEKSEQEEFKTLDTGYEKISDIARTLGKGEHFQYLNELLSKFAHPTALSVVYDNREVLNKLEHKFYLIGVGLAEEALGIVQQLVPEGQ